MEYAEGEESWYSTVNTQAISTATAASTAGRQIKINPENRRLYGIALNNRFPKRSLLYQAGRYTPCFIACALVLPWVMAMVLNDHSTAGREAAAKRMTRATLRNHFRCTVRDARLPTVVKSRSGADSDAAVDGMLVMGLDEESASRVEEYVKLDLHTKEVEEVDVEAQGGEVVTLAAHVYVWNGPMNMLEPRSWTPMAFMRGECE